jgi:hypothetical protein
MTYPSPAIGSKSPEHANPRFRRGQRVFNPAIAIAHSGIALAINIAMISATTLPCRDIYHL